MAKRQDGQFWESTRLNNATYQYYYRRLFGLSISCFEYKNLPESVDERFMELALFADGNALFFEDPAMGHLCLRSANVGPLNVYGIPMQRHAYASNGYNADRTEKDSVIIYDNYERWPLQPAVAMYAYRLYIIERAIDTNVNAQRTPLLIQCDEEERLSFVNLMKQYEGNIPFIFATRGLNIEGVKVFPTDAKYVGKDLQELKQQIWNEALTMIGIANANFVKRERLLSDEVARSMGGVIASRYSRLESRRDAVDKINDMFGLNIEVNFRDTTDEYRQIAMDTAQIDMSDVRGDANEQVHN